MRRLKMLRDEIEVLRARERAAVVEEEVRGGRGGGRDKRRVKRKTENENVRRVVDEWLSQEGKRAHAHYNPWAGSQ